MSLSLDPSLILAEALDAPTPEQSLDRYPEHREALAPLLAAALELRMLPDAAPSGEFRSTARARLLAKLPARPAVSLNTLTPLAALSGWWQTLFPTRRPTLNWVVAGVLALMVVGAGVTTAAAESALPGQALYPVKRWVESARVALTANSSEAEALRLSFAARRLSEAAALAQAAQPEAVAETLAAYAAELGEAQRNWRTPPAQAAALLAEQAALLEQLESQPVARNLRALAEARSALREARAALEEVGQPPLTTASRTPTPTGTPVPTFTASSAPTLTASPVPTQHRLINCVPQPWPSTLPAPTGLPTCAPGTLPAQRATTLPATLTALPTSLPATLTARPPLPTRIQATLTALPTNLPATLTALPTRLALPTDLPATLTALPGDLSGTLTALPPRRPDWQSTPPAGLPTLVLPPQPPRPPRP